MVESEGEDKGEGIRKKKKKETHKVMTVEERKRYKKWKKKGKEKKWERKEENEEGNEEGWEEGGKEENYLWVLHWI